jgi:Zn-finger nucleic acid-binding protein
MKCPVDSSPLIVVEREGIELDYCTKCKGIWFDAGELELLAEALQENIEIPDFLSSSAVHTTEKARKSPRSGKRMDKINMGDKEHPIIVDRDRDGHGLWFDWGELGQVLERHAATAGTGEKRIIKFLGETFRF